MICDRIQRLFAPVTRVMGSQSTVKGNSRQEQNVIGHPETQKVTDLPFKSEKRVYEIGRQKNNNSVFVAYLVWASFWNYTAVCHKWPACWRRCQPSRREGRKSQNKLDFCPSVFKEFKCQAPEGPVCLHLLQLLRVFKNTQKVKSSSIQKKPHRCLANTSNSNAAKSSL